MKLGFVGTGNMGNPMARNLIAAGHTLTVYDLRPAATANLRELGAFGADSPRAVAEASEVVFTSLPGPADVESAVLDPERGILAGLAAGRVYIDVSTNSPVVFRRIAAACRAKGVEALDAPVSGGAAGAENATLAIMAGGDAAAFERCRPLLECLGPNLYHVGEAGAGNVAKLVNNLLFFSNFVAGAEALLIGAKAGVDAGQLAEIISKSSGNSLAMGVFPRLLAGEYGFSFTLDLAAKDVGLAHELARDVGAPSRIAEMVEGVLKRGQARGWGQEACTIAVRILEEMAGAEITAPPAR